MAVAGIEVVGTLEKARTARTYRYSIISLKNQMCINRNSRNLRAVPSFAMICPPMFSPNDEFPFTLGPNVVVSCSASITVYDTLAKP